MIITAAIKKGNVVYTGRRHDRAILNATNEKGERVKFGPERSIQGFVNDKGEFLNREQAGKEAYECGQINKPTNMLLSEDLYDGYIKEILTKEQIKCLRKIGMTHEEISALDIVSLAAKNVLSLATLHHMEKDETARAIHIIQDMIMARPGFRALGMKENKC